jgi:hypothetical protein
MTQTLQMTYQERGLPRTVTRDLPHYVIGKDYQRLVRLARLVDHQWHRGQAFGMLVRQYERLYTRLYRTGGAITD